MTLRQFLRILVQAQRAIRAYWTNSVFIVCAISLGIAALTVILASMEGASRKAEELAAKFGPTSINIIGGNLVEQAMASRPMTLTWNDVRRIGDCMPGAERVSPLLLKAAVQVQSGGRRHTTDSLVGTGAEHGPSWGWYPETGRDFTREDLELARSVCLIGAATAQVLFGSADPLGRIVVVDRVPLVVIGVLTRQGLSSGDMDFDDRVTVPITTMIRRFNLSRHYLSQVRVTFAKSSTPQHMAEYSRQLRGLLRSLHGIQDGAADDFLLVTMQDIMDFVDVVKGSIVIFLGLVAVVTMLTGGFTQANLFYLAVTDRSVEIGLKKALGASSQAIFVQFLLEAVLLACLGALAGLAIGAAFGALLSSFDLLSISLSPTVFLLAVLMACAIGCAFGVRPARKAAGLAPVSALRGLS
ncbi:MAG TPA: ABC transporter permease [Candidatus Desulfovibrio intestinipullorum]|uniref:ABC transporter permease n=1 Tax=Candidatus Desulfovibrio intestinipullorum TaxID=2838536 RepID=A0A9D1PVS3_9BACT|nr:ABC transporter permease [Candidatus Desulfovibrio intestinipullorum]